jgi:hypothetical protein
MSCKNARRWFYYRGAGGGGLGPGRGKVALLVIDMQNTYLDQPDPT